MFKIESYITPLLMGYIDKYVKLKQEDFQLSLWGGDAILNKLDLRLETIEKALPFPITLKSGHIHELRIHVPWTKLGSEPVVITINTIECILKLKDSASDDSDTASSASGSMPRTPSQVARQKARRPDAEDLPPGYLQSIVNRIMNNVHIVINNLILKFVEDDIVLSLNIKSAECYAVSQEWQRAFVDLTMPELVLRRVIDFQDLTVCLDKRDASGKIEAYQDPLLYRCSMTCRIHMTYDGLSAKMPSILKFSVYCNKFDLSLTDTQVPMYFRLVELALALYYGEFDLPGAAAEQNDPAAPTKGEVISADEIQDGWIEGGGEDGEGWASWAWSYVPQILPSEGEGADTLSQKKEPLTVSFGFYIKNASVIFKMTEYKRERQFGGGQKFQPCMTFETYGIGLDVLIRGLTFFNVQMGITSTRVLGHGEAPCGIKDLECTHRNPVFLWSKNLEQSNEKTKFLECSLFDPDADENQGERPRFVFDEKWHKETFTEVYGMDKFGALWMDYLYTMDEPADREGSSHASSSSQTDVFDVENSNNMFVVGPLHLVCSSSMYQRVHKFIHCMGQHDYQPYATPKEEIVDEKRPVPTEVQVRSLEKFISKRTKSLTILDPTVTVHAADLPHADVSKKVYSQRKKKKVPTATLR